MPRYTADSKERVRDAIDFVELVNARTELRKSGQRRYTGLCPFHDERTPSFGIDPVEKLYHCFGCGEGGDVFKFVMETEGLDFSRRWSRWPSATGVELEREEEDPRDAARASGASAAARAAGPHRGLLRARAVGVAGGRRRARVPARPRAVRGALRAVPGRLLAVGVGHGLNASRRAGFTNEEVLRRRARGPRGARRAGSYDASAARSCSRCRRARPRARLRGARDAPDGSGRSTSTRARARSFHKGRPAASAPTSPARRRRRPAASCWWRATPT